MGSRGSLVGVHPWQALQEQAARESACLVWRSSCAGTPGMPMLLRSACSQVCFFSHQDVNAWGKKLHVMYITQEADAFMLTEEGVMKEEEANTERRGDGRCAGVR